MTATHDARHMQRACELAMRGRGSVEPNPMVGCVIAVDDTVIAEGFHQAFGKPHAEIAALANVPPASARVLRKATLYSTLEPCSHFGKTPPCTEAIIASGIKRVVVGIEDPYAEVSGSGIAALRNAGLQVDVGVIGDVVEQQLAPYLKRVKNGLPWIVAKWAMSADGKIATRTGDSKWISGPDSRKIVHELRGRVDAIMVGIETALADDPSLTARPPGPRTPARIVLDSDARLPPGSELVRTADEIPTLIVAKQDADNDAMGRLIDAGVEMLQVPGQSPNDRLQKALEELGRRRMTNILVEGGGKVLGSLFDLGLVDEVHMFVAPVVLGGSDAPTASAGVGVRCMTESLRLIDVNWRMVGEDLYASGRVSRNRQDVR